MSVLQPEWRQRPREEANLFNPAFTSFLIARAVAHHERTDPREAMPFPLSFMVLPIVLHAPTREALPRAADTNMVGWISEHQHIKACFPALASRLVPITQEAIRFGLAYRKLKLERDRIASGADRYKVTTVPSPATDETKACLAKAAFLGRWFAYTNSTINIMAAWGVRP